MDRRKGGVNPENRHVSIESLSLTVYSMWLPMATTENAEFNVGKGAGYGTETVTMNCVDHLDSNPNLEKLRRVP